MLTKIPFMRRARSILRKDGIKSLVWSRRIWLCGTGLGLIYFFAIYILPLYKVITTPIVPFKYAVELFVCLTMIMSGIALGKLEIEQQPIEITVEKGMLFVDVAGRTTGISCLEIISASGSVYADESGQPKYNSSMLLAMRAGMSKSVNFAFEAGVSRGEPFLRIFITVVGIEVDIIKETLRREATRIEAILLASLNLVELRLLEDNDLSKATGSFFNDFGGKSRDSSSEELDDIALLVMKGIPGTNPSFESSQIGTFLTTVLKQNYSASVTCIFSASKPGKEKRKLESKWKVIQSKERRKEESLKDHADKKKLISEYEEIQDNVGWFDTSVYFTIKADSSMDITTAREGLSGLILSVWGGGKNTIKLIPQKISEKRLFRFLTRKHVKKQRMHVSRLASFINTPIRKLPILSPETMPIFPIPARDSMSDDIDIGNTIFEGRPFSKAGLSVESMREHVAIIGATGTGKTTLVKHIITQISQKTEIPWWVFDIKGTEYSGLVGQINNEILILKPGLDSSFVIGLIDPEFRDDENYVYSTFAMLRELMKEKGESSELSPAMERLLRESIAELAKTSYEYVSIQSLANVVSKSSSSDRIGQMTKDALLNRLQVLYQEPLGSILAGGPTAVKISDLMEKRVILDLSHVARTGGMEAARLLYNLIAKRIFDSAMKRGIVPGLHHIVVLEEASNLVPESYSKQSSADVTTGESMVLLQRATGQGVIVVSTRPNISSNILANTATKIVFRLPYDSQIGGKFLSLNQEQEVYLRSMKRGRALVAIPNAETFEIATRLYVDKFPPASICSSESVIDDNTDESPMSIIETSLKDPTSKSMDTDTLNTREEDAQTVVFDRVGRFRSQIIAYLASEGMTNEQQIRNLLSTLDTSVMEDDISEVVREFVTSGTIDREALSLVPGGFIYTLPNQGLKAVKTVILEYVCTKLGVENNSAKIHDAGEEFPDLIIEDKAVVIIPEHLKTSSLESVLAKIRYHMRVLGNGTNEMFIIVRGSIAAAKLREILDDDDEFNAINVVSAFPSSLDSMIEILEKSLMDKDTINEPQAPEDSNDVELIEAIHEVGPATSRAIQIRLWFGLIQDFVDLSDGWVRWEFILDFIETTALQSLKGRSAPLTAEEGRRALTELLADEVLIALRINEKSVINNIEQGLWIINSSALQKLKDSTVGIIKAELEKHHSSVFHDHGYYDLCAGTASYVIFPNQQQLSTLLNLHSDVACRTCKSTHVVCVLTASEYLEDSIMTPENLIVRTMDDNISALVT